MAKVIKHYGIIRRSGRYPWGSGGNAKQRTEDFISIVDDLKKEGFNRTEIANALGISTTEYDQLHAVEKSKQRAANISRAVQLKNTGMSNTAIAEEMGRNESTIRSWLEPVAKEKAQMVTNVANTIKDTISKKGPVDIGGGVEANIGISRTKLLAAVKQLEQEGYKRYFVQTQQLGTGKYTSIMVLAPPGMEYKELWANRANIATITDHTPDGGRTLLGLNPVQSVDGSRVQVRYSEEGGSNKDGVIELRRNVNDLDLGSSKYAQVRIAVDGTHYLKGMAMYSDNMPDGIDMVYNTKKPVGTPREEVFKTLKDDPDNPFGATINRQNGALNILSEEGDWTSWSRNLSSQVLSKQSPKLAQKQLDLDKNLRKEEFDEIMSLTNPVVKQRLLESFADGCDSAAVNLKAAALPRQSSHVILPITDMKPNEIYAPMYNNGEVVALIRHPHGGTFEIPELVVNNKNTSAKSVMQDARDAVGIHPDVAKKLSGADFDGDTVIVIPNDKGNIKTSPSLKGLKDFDPIETYPKYDGMKTIDGGKFNAETGRVEYGPKGPSGRGKQLEMGKVSNLITDMTIKGATQAEIARAVRHSMVVIDAEKHVLNYKQSEIDNGIQQLKQKYQDSPGFGASTVVSRASSQIRVNARKEGILVTDPITGKKRRQYIDPNTGKKLYTETGEEYVNKDGKIVKSKQLSTKMAEAKSAFDLSSGTQMEDIYASYADSLKTLANRARKETLNIPRLKVDKTATKVYQKEVESLLSKINEAERNRPKERQAQLLANKIYRAKLKANDAMDESEKKRLRGQALTEARHRMGAKKPEFDISDREWTAIQLGALSHNRVQKVVQYADLDILKQKSIPRTAYKMTDAKVARAKMMATAGYTAAEIASALGVSATTIVDTIGN